MQLAMTYNIIAFPLHLSYKHIYPQLQGGQNG